MCWKMLEIGRNFRGRNAGTLLVLAALPVVAQAESPADVPVPANVPATAVSAPSFRNDVMVVLSQAGCNRGTCHGNAAGKGGFRLSLRGYDPAADWLTLTRDQTGRRINPANPDESLLLLKPTMGVPHEGGRRFAVDSWQHRVLRDWIATGGAKDLETAPVVTALEVQPSSTVVTAPDWQVQLTAVARFSDGATRDVAAQAVYEPSAPFVRVTPTGEVSTAQAGEVTIAVRFLDRQFPVRLAFIPPREDFVWSGPQPRSPIDQFLFAKLRTLRLNPAPPADDAARLRRAYLDLLGVLPTAAEARAFVQSSDPARWERLVDRLLDRREFAETWALKWADLLRNEEKTIDRKGVENFHAWLKLQFARGVPMDEFARSVIAAQGSTYARPAANYYRALRDPLTRGEATAQVFLGIRLQCAKCHNHPFDRWTQDDYYGWANLFARVDYKIVENRRRDDNDSHEFDGEQHVYQKRRGDFDDPRTGRPQPARFLGADRPLEAEDDRLAALADWTTSPDNPFFARAQVNRIWAHLMGRGLVEPIDDFRMSSPPSHPELLDWLADDFVASGYDLRHTVRTILLSAAYQLSSQPGEDGASEAENYARTEVRRLTSEQLLDGLCQVAGASARFNGYPPGIRAGQLPGVQAVRRRDSPPSEGDAFLVLFGKPARLQSCECERSGESTLAQAFQLISGPLGEELLTRRNNRLDQWLGDFPEDGELVDEVFWTVLSRVPTAEEAQALASHLARSDNRRRALEDIVWSLTNSAEFLLRR